MDLRGRKALVTGGAKRLGRAFALALADAGADVVVHYGRSDSDAEAVVGEIRSKGRKAEAVRADLADAAAAPRAVADAEARVGPLDILVNSAAIFEKGTLDDTALRNWDAHLAINLRAPFLLSQAFARAAGSRPGKVVNIADWRAVAPGRAYLAYTVSKAGLLTLTRFAARELAPRIQVNALALGAVLPPAGADAAHLEAVTRSTPAGRPATLAEVCDALLFLLRNDFITGETLFVDGGAHLQHG